MRTMFANPENNSKKKFQKPNILRKRPKAPLKSTTSVTNSPVAEPLVTTASAAGPGVQVENVKKCKQQTSKVPRTIVKNNMKDGSSINELYQIDAAGIDTQLSLAEGTSVTSSEDVSQSTFNVEAFLNSDSRNQVEMMDIEDEYNSRLKQEWCLDFINNAQEIIIEDIDGSHLGSLRVAPGTVADTSLPATSWQSEQTEGDAAPPPVQNLTLEYLANSTMNYKCDAPDCNKRFRSEQKLTKHKQVHNKSPEVRHTTIECPVKKVVDGTEEPCGVFCASKEELVKHLNETHDPEDAMYICSECGRRFFWASGLRAHARAHWARGAALACAWPGCGRAFRQPCRLREHMRAHTGDKPYPCRYPNCGWSFRTASKLLRHARRHTGERRHACSACPRAFRRREHLRDHAARAHRHPPHPPHTPHTHACTQHGCQKTFTNIESLKSHVKKVHSQKLVISEVAATDETEEETAISLPEVPPEETFMVSLGSPSYDEEVPAVESSQMLDVSAIDASPGAESGTWRAARTHCTWPLGAARTGADAQQDPQYVLEEDVQVELSEGSESNTYTIRSDLFLHGNILNNEDSEQMASVGPGSLLDGAAAADAHLGLLDAHPTIDLMQEELMYTDSAVDESSFRVFLLSGEELA